MKKVLINCIWYHLSSLGMFTQNTPQMLRDMRIIAGILPLYERWLQEAMRIFNQEHYVHDADGKITPLVDRQFNEDSVLEEWRQKKIQWLASPNLSAYVTLMDATLPFLADILVGKKTAQEVMFPNSSLKLVENTYKHNETSTYFNRELAKQVTAYLKKLVELNNQARIRILEIGAGTGATSAIVLETLKPWKRFIAEYCYTDISKAFLNYAETSYGSDNPFLTYRIFNIERSLSASDIEPKSFDVVIAANVLHATKNIKETIRHAKSVLKNKGGIFLNEITQNNLINHVTFGLLEGWWRYEDPKLRIPGCPLLSPNTWKQVLEDEGFHSITFPCYNAIDLGQQIIVAVNNENHSESVVQPTIVSVKNLLTPAINNGLQEHTHQVQQYVEQTVIDEIAKSLQIDKQRINVHEPFSRYGLDSIIAVNLTRTINQVLAISLDITVMFEYSSIAQLTQFILSKYEKKINAALDLTCKVSTITDSVVSMPLMKNNNVHKHIHSESIAVIGMSGIFPSAKSVHQFWQNIINGNNCITKAPLKRMDWQEFSTNELKEKFHIDNKWGGFLEDVHTFDPLFFDISPKEALYMSPEERLLLMEVWKVLEDSSITPQVLSQDTTGVFIATGPSDYQHLKVYSPEIQLNNLGFITSPALSLIPNRISYLLDLHGPSEYCETACSSSLVALHRAVQAIVYGECTQAIVGSVNLLLSPMSYLGLEAAGMLSSTGESKPFQEEANGFVKGEGVGVLLVKSLVKAQEDSDYIYAVIKGTGVIHGGKGISFTAPNVGGMKAAMLMAYKQADINPQTISYIETQGVGSALADAAEINALKSGFEELIALQSHEKMLTEHKCYLGNLKPYMGHAEVFSGMAAVIKVILAIRNKQIPAISNFGQLNKNIPLQGSSFEIARENIAWEASDLMPRRASVNGYGIGGVNAHVVLEEYCNEENILIENSSMKQHIIILSAKTQERLLERVKQLFEFIDSAKDIILTNLAYTLQVGREAMPVRVAFVVSTIIELRTVLNDFANSKRLEQATYDVKVFWSDLEDNNTEIMSLFYGHVGDKLLNLLFSEGKLVQIARFWTMGASMNWTLLYTNQKPQKIPLPTYPFEKRPCWLALTPKIKHSNSCSIDQKQKNNDTIQKFVSDIVSSILGLLSDEINDEMPFHHYGVNSIMLIEMVTLIKARFPSFPATLLKPKDTLHSLIEKLTSVSYGAVLTENEVVCNKRVPELIHLNTITEGSPIFWIHGGLGGVESYIAIAATIKRPFYAIQARGFMTQEIPLQGITEMAKYYIKLIQSVQPNGPYEVGGFCLGGIISYEIARQLQHQKQSICSLVMIDSPDNTGLQKAHIAPENAIKNAALQVTNLLLWPVEETNRKKIIARLIHQQDLDNSLNDKKFFLQLVKLAKIRGSSLSQKQILAFIEQNVAIQMAYRINEYRIQPLPQHDEITCYYFRNASELFYGDLTPFFSIVGDSFSLDKVNYWQDWQLQLPYLNIIELNAPNHMLVMTDKKSVKTINKFCNTLYS